MTKVDGSTDTFDQAAATITLNGAVVSNPSFYAPTGAGTNGYVLKSNGSGAPTWLNPSSLSVGSATNATYLAGSASSSQVPVDDVGTGKIRYYYNVSKNLAGNMPHNNNANGILYLNTHAGEYGHQLGFSSDGNIYQRCKSGTAFIETTAWRTILTSSNYSSYCASASHTHSAATTSVNGFMSAADKTTLNNLSDLVGDTSVSAQINTAIGQVSQQISQKAETFTTTAVFPHGSWVASTSGFPYEQTVTCSGVLTTDTPFVDVDLSAYTTYLEKRIENWAAVARVTVLQDNTITAYLSEELPNSVNTPMIVKVVR